jgi:4-amino-4-deoxy-L-arabinose transferase-like glycosyltransferase
MHYALRAMNTHTSPPLQLSRRATWLILAAILLAAAFLRLYRLDAIPPGWTHDEAGHGHDAVAILHGARPIYEAVGYGREPLYDYVVAGLMALMGPTSLALRLVSVIFGLGTLAITFAWVRLAFDSPTALAAVALQAASFWSLATSRQALRSSLLPALFTFAVYFFWRSIYRPKASPDELPLQASRWPMVLFALFICATLYTYLPARVMWMIFPVFLVYLGFCHRVTFRRVWLVSLVAIVISLLLFTPLLLYLQAHPGAEQRLAMLDAPLQALRTGDIAVILNRALSGASAFFLPGQGDDFLAYTIPGRPFFDPLVGTLFLVGLVICLARWREPTYTFSLIWFLIGASPTLVTGAPASITRSIAALPVAFLFPALAVVEGACWAATRWGARAMRVIWLGCVALVIITATISARDYFAWGESLDVRAAYQHTLVEIARYLAAQSENGTVAISTVYPQAPHDPYVFEMSLRRNDLATRWFDARTAILIPSESTARLIVPASTPLAAMEAAMGIAAYDGDLAGLRVRERVRLRPDDLDPSFVVYDWEPAVTLRVLREHAQSQSVNLGNVVQLIGYDLRTPQVKPGDAIELITLWQVTDPQSVRDTGLVLFTHALNAAGKVVGQEDRLDAPAWDWRPGDVIAQLHRFTLPSDATGTLTIEVGAYKPTDLTRLPILVNGVTADNRILLTPVEVR